MAHEVRVHFPELGWLADIDPVDQPRFLADLGAAINEARVTGDRAVVERCLHAWHLTVAAMETAEWRERMRSED